MGYTFLVAKTQTAIRLNPLTLKTLQSMAKKEKENVSELIRKAVDEFVERRKSKK
jgi:predicted transcriptional regulator